MKRRLSLNSNIAANVVIGTTPPQIKMKPYVPFTVASPATPIEKVTKISSCPKIAAKSSMDSGLGSSLSESRVKVGEENLC